MRRLIDIFCGIFFSIVFLPLIIVISILIKLDSSGPIFFISKRVGQNNVKFKMIKFRTMYSNTELVETSKLKNPNLKITKVGKLLRNFSIDEIPQFLNVIMEFHTAISVSLLISPAPLSPHLLANLPGRHPVLV